MMTAAARRWWRNAAEYLPKGQSLPEDAWRTRHRALCWLLRAHVVGIFIFFGGERGQSGENGEQQGKRKSQAHLWQL